MLETLEELEALPLYSIVILPSGQAARKHQDRWRLFGTDYRHTPTEGWLPAKVIHTAD